MKSTRWTCKWDPKSDLPTGGSADHVDQRGVWGKRFWKALENERISASLCNAVRFFSVTSTKCGEKS